MNPSEDPLVQKQEHSPRTTKTSSVLGVISIILALIALIITSCNLDGSMGEVLAIVLFAFPLMISSLIISIIGLLLRSKTLIGKKLSTIGLILTFFPIAVALAPALEEWIEDKRYNTFVDGVKFNKEMTVLISYSENKKETNYTIPESVTIIRNHAFANCTSLTSITIPDSVTSIGDRAFYHCNNLKSITIPDGVTSIGWGAFWNCSSLTSITIPNGVTSIGSGVFGDCSSLKTIKVGAGNVNYTEVNGVMFNTEKTVLHTYPAGKAVTNYSIPDSVTRIGEMAFMYCDSLTSITIPDGVTRIGRRAIGNCSSLTAVTFLGDAPEEDSKGHPSGWALWRATPTIYRKPEAKGWGETFAGRPVKLISEKP